MAQTVIDLTEEHFKRIGTYVRNHFHEWLLEDRRVSGDVVIDQLNRIENALEASIILTRERFELMNSRFELAERNSQEHFELMEKRFEAIDRRFEAMDKKFEERFAAIDRRFELVEQRFRLVDQRFDQMNARMNRQFTVLLSVSGTLFAGIVGLLLQGFLP
jgi:hypothetical protein